MIVPNLTINFFALDKNEKKSFIRKPDFNETYNINAVQHFSDFMKTKMT